MGMKEMFKRCKAGLDTEAERIHTEIIPEHDSVDQFPPS